MDASSIESILQQHTGDAILIADRAGNITFWSDGAEAMLGFSRAQALGASLDLIIPAHLRERHWAGFAGVISSGVSPSPAWVKTPVLHADGTVARMAITVVLLKQGASACRVLAILVFSSK
jgi:PAS domain S-box-containing protein